MNKIEISEFFDDLDLPIFLTEEFQSESWYLLLVKLNLILDKAINQSQILTNADSLKIQGKVFIGEDCKIGENVVIQGPVYIGNNVTLSPFSYIRPGSVILDNARVGTYGIVKNSIMMRGSSTSDYCYLGDSILGTESMMGAHSTTLNQKFDKSEISFKFKDTEVHTIYTKFGAIIGDKTRLGGGVLTTPGTLIGKRTYIYPSVVVEGYIPSDKFVTVKKEVIIKDNKFSDTLRSS